MQLGSQSVHDIMLRSARCWPLHGHPPGIVYGSPRPSPSIYRVSLPGLKITTHQLRIQGGPANNSACSSRVEGIDVWCMAGRTLYFTVYRISAATRHDYYPVLSFLLHPLFYGFVFVKSIHRPKLHLPGNTTGSKSSKTSATTNPGSMGGCSVSGWWLMS